MADAARSMKRGEKITIVASFVANPSQTITLQATPTFTLYDSSNVVVTGWNAVNVSAYQSTALLSPTATMLLDSVTPTNLAAGNFTGVFKATAIGADGLSQILERNVQIVVSEAYA